MALIGASGSGKSTLLRCIDLLEEIDDGDVFLDGEVITDPAVDAGRGAPPARPRLPGLQPLPAPDRARERGPRRDAGARRSPAPRRRSAGRELLARFGLAGREDDRPDNLSGGQQQRVAIARAFAGRPRALLLDEVTSALDPELVGEVLAAVRDLKAEGMTMVIATHEMSFAREVADEVAFLHEGRIVEHGPPEQVLDAPAAARRPSASSAACSRPVASRRRFALQAPGSRRPRRGTFRACPPSAAPASSSTASRRGSREFCWSIPAAPTGRNETSAPGRSRRGNTRRARRRATAPCASWARSWARRPSSTPRR